MVTAQEIIVSLKSQGAQQTADDVGRVEDRFAEASSTIDDSAGMLGGFAAKFGGVMSTIIAGFAVATAGLLSQVPVVGEVFGGLKSIFDGLIIQLDEELRPALQPLTDDLYEIGNAIAAGDWEGAKNSASDFASEINSMDFSAGVEDLSDFAVNTVDGLVTTFTEEARKLKPEDFETATGAFMNAFQSAVFKAIKTTDWSAFAVEVIALFAKALWGGMKGFAKNMQFPIQAIIVRAFANAIDGAEDWGEDLIDRFIDGIKNKASELRTAFENIQIGGGLSVGDILGGGSNGSVDTTSSSGGGGGLPAGLGINDLSLNLDGRSLIESTGRHDKDRVTRR